MTGPGHYCGQGSLQGLNMNEDTLVNQTVFERRRTKSSWVTSGMSTKSCNGSRNGSRSAGRVRIVCLSVRYGSHQRPSRLGTSLALREDKFKQLSLNPTRAPPESCEIINYCKRKSQASVLKLLQIIYRERSM